MTMRTLYRRSAGVRSAGFWILLDLAGLHIAQITSCRTKRAGTKRPGLVHLSWAGCTDVGGSCVPAVIPSHARAGCPVCGLPPVDGLPSQPPAAARARFDLISWRAAMRPGATSGSLPVIHTPRTNPGSADLPHSAGSARVAAGRCVDHTHCAPAGWASSIHPLLYLAAAGRSQAPQREGRLYQQSNCRVLSGDRRARPTVSRETRPCDNAGVLPCICAVCLQFCLINQTVS
jgi:hypothetical protein